MTPMETAAKIASGLSLPKAQRESLIESVRMALVEAANCELEKRRTVEREYRELYDAVMDLYRRMRVDGIVAYNHVLEGLDATPTEEKV